VFRDSDEAGVVDHKQIDRALLEWFAVEVSVDVVFGFASASLIDRV